jgi:hypothetical protein
MFGTLAGKGEGKGRDEPAALNPFGTPANSQPPIEVLHQKN